MSWWAWILPGGGAGKNRTSAGPLQKYFPRGFEKTERMWSSLNVVRRKRP